MQAHMELKTVVQDRQQWNVIMRKLYYQPRTEKLADNDANAETLSS